MGDGGGPQSRRSAAGAVPPISPSSQAVLRRPPERLRRGVRRAAKGAGGCSSPGAAGRVCRFLFPRLLIKEGTGSETQTHPGVERSTRRKRGQTRTAGEGLSVLPGGGGEESTAKERKECILRARSPPQRRSVRRGRSNHTPSIRADLGRPRLPVSGEKTRFRDCKFFDSVL